VLWRWRFGIDAAVVAAAVLGVAWGSSTGGGWAPALLCFVAVLAGGTFAPSYRRAVVRAILASVTAIQTLVEFGPDAFTESLFEGNQESLSVSLPELFPALAALVLIPAILTALVAHALASAWRTRDPQLEL